MLDDLYYVNILKFYENFKYILAGRRSFIKWYGEWPDFKVIANYLRNGKVLLNLIASDILKFTSNYLCNEKIRF